MKSIKNREISHWMTKNPVSLCPKTSVLEAKSLFKSKKVRHLPVISAGEVLGVLHERTLAMTEALLSRVKMDSFSVDHLPLNDALLIRPNESLTKVCKKMAAKKHDCAIVSNGEQVLGIFTLVDALRAIPQIMPNESHRMQKKRANKPVRISERKRVNL